MTVSASQTQELSNPNVRKIAYTVGASIKGNFVHYDHKGCEHKEF